MKSMMLVAMSLTTALTVAAGSLGMGVIEPQAPGSGVQPAPSAAAPAGQPGTPDLKSPTLYVVGYAHLDTQWRWTYADTIREFIPNTLTRNFALFEKYPSYVFNFSGSRRYQMMEEYYPADFATMKKYIAAGRWFPCGSSVDENDANVPSAESLVRQVLYGNKYFRQQFGIASDEYMLPDCFGFPAALPSVLAHCGVKGFSTQKLTWNAVVPIPFKVGVWEGPDGHSVVSALDPGAYVGEVKNNLANDNGWLQRIQNNGQKSGTFVDYHYFGTGDQGGAPDEASVAKVEESVKTDGKIKVISAPADAMFKAITPAQREKLPTYRGELELTEHSAGSLTSQAYMKRWNRKNELLADAAERASVTAWWLGGRSYPGAKLENAWYLVLGSQMHDILPGTSVPKAYDYSWNDEVLAGNLFGSVLEDASNSIISGMDTRAAGKGTPLVIYNPLSAEREDVVEAEVASGGSAPKGVKVTGPDGKTVPAQVLGTTGGTTKVAFLGKAPAVGYAAYSVEFTGDAGGDSKSTLAVSADGRQLDNERYTVKLNDHGDVASIFDKQAKRELLSAPAQLALAYENPSQWPAWNQDWADRQRPVKSYAGASGPVSFKVVENGPARVAVEVTREAEGSTFVQRIRLGSGGASARVEFDNQIDWRTRERSLRASFPLSVSNPKATYDIQVGAIERGNGQPKQFEYAFHQWFDVTDAKGDYGVTTMCDSKFGADKPSDNTVRLTLLHTPGTQGGYPDQGSQDLGRHHVLYAIQGHASDWKKGESFAQAARLNQPMIAFRAAAHEGTLGKTFSLMRVSTPAVSISAIKKAEEGDEVVVRLREHTGGAQKGVRLAAARPIISAREIDGQEREIGKATVTNGELVVDMNSFELRAFAVKLGDAPATLTKVDSMPVALAYDTDVASTNAKLDDGAIDDKGHALPAEQIPASVTLEDVKFNFGPTADGKTNAVACKGQEITLPEGSFDRLYILATANGDVTANVQVDGKDFPIHAQNWSGYIGQWDHRDWPGDTSDPRYPWGSTDVTGIEPGFIKPAAVAWYSSHYHIPSGPGKGNAFYEYCYVFKHGIDLPAGAKTLKLPNDPRIKVLAVSAAKTSGTQGTVAAAGPLFDSLGEHAQDAPRVILPAQAGKGAYSDAITVAVEPGLYWRQGGIHYTTDGSEPTAQSPVYAGPVTLSASTTIKAAIVDASGKVGPAASSAIEIKDTTAPTITRVSALFQSPKVRVEFSEPVDGSAAEASHYAVEPAIAVSTVELSKDRRSATVTLASAPEVKKTYGIKVQGVKDGSPAGNVIKAASVEFSVAGPVYTLAEVSAAQKGTQIKDVPGLPVHGNDPWTMNMFVRMDKQPSNHTVIAGFGNCADEKDGGARYIAKFAGGVHFWARNRDVSGRTPFDLNRWQMITATYDGTVLRLYKDGAQIGERPVKLVDEANVINIAPMDPWDKMYQFSGDIRGLTIWGSALGAEAIESLKGTGPTK